MAENKPTYIPAKDTTISTVKNAATTSAAGIAALNQVVAGLKQLRSEAGGALQNQVDTITAEVNTMVKGLGG